jgi:hypothetical protein
MKNKRAPLTFRVDSVAPPVAEAVQPELPANAQTAKRAKAKPGPGREGRVFIASHVLPDAAKQFKLLAVQQEKTTQDLMVEAINDLFAKYGLSRIA